MAGGALAIASDFRCHSCRVSLELIAVCNLLFPRCFGDTGNRTNLYLRTLRQIRKTRVMYPITAMSGGCGEVLMTGADRPYPRFGAEGFP
jgi:uncharacterized radical SAM superfamily Fe-S cluster-containing enzyme